MWHNTKDSLPTNNNRVLVAYRLSPNKWQVQILRYEVRTRFMDEGWYDDRNIKNGAPEKWQEIQPPSND